MNSITHRSMTALALATSLALAAPVLAQGQGSQSQAATATRADHSRAGIGTAGVGRDGTTTATTGMRSSESAAVARGNRAIERASDRSLGAGGERSNIGTRDYTTTASTGVGGGSAGMSATEFVILDVDRDGFIERSELGADNRLAQDDYNRFDLDNDGRLSRYEYDSLSSGAFTSLDRNRDNWLDQQETGNFASLNSNFANADLDGDGRISRAEHAAFIDAGTWSTAQDRYAFRYLDADDDGFISRTEAQSFTGFDEQFDALDEDADDLIDQQVYDSFLNDWDEDDYVYDPQ